MYTLETLHHIMRDCNIPFEVDILIWQAEKAIIDYVQALQKENAELKRKLPEYKPFTPCDYETEPDEDEWYTEVEVTFWLEMDFAGGGTFDQTLFFGGDSTNEDEIAVNIEDWIEHCYKGQEIADFRIFNIHVHEPRI